MRLLIADDEAQTRIGLINGIDWQGLGITEINIAEDGLEALDIVSKYHPEIIITDICMPGLDGLEISREALKINSEIKIIIISGYSSFEYAKEAIKIGVAEYFLKPIDLDALVNKVKDSIKHINDQKQQQNKLRDIQKQALHKQWEEWYSGDEPNEAGLTILSALLDLKLDQSFICCCFSIDNQDIKNLNKKMRYLGLCLEPFLEENIKALAYSQGMKYFILARTTLKDDPYTFYERMSECHRAVNTAFNNQFQSSVTLALGSLSKTEHLREGLNSCESMLAHRMYLGKGSIIQNYVLNKQSVNYFSGYDEEELRAFIIEASYEKAVSFIKASIFESLRESRITSGSLVKSVCLQLKNTLFKRLEEIGISIDEILDKNRDLISDIPDYLILEDYLQWVDDLYYLILQGAMGSLSKRHSHVISNALLYMNLHYSEELSLEVVAAHIDKSKNYFSYLFKKEMGISFVEYLNKLRVEKAKLLLDSTDDATYQISEAVGFRDYKYFATVFKKLEGVSPSGYRSR